MTDATPSLDADMVSVVITADHVYLPLDENGAGRIDWSVGNVSTTKVERRARLPVPADLAVFLSDRDQAEILLRSSGASQDSSSEAPAGA